MNWIPIETIIKVEDELYAFSEMPIFSVSGIKQFINAIDQVVAESNKGEEMLIGQNNDEFICGATEGEFHIIFKNAYEENLIHVELWINTVCLKNSKTNYFKGFLFNVFSEDLELFNLSLKEQCKS